MLVSPPRLWLRYVSAAIAGHYLRGRAYGCCIRLKCLSDPEGIFLLPTGLVPGRRISQEFYNQRTVKLLAGGS